MDFVDGSHAEIFDATLRTDGGVLLRDGATERYLTLDGSGNVIIQDAESAGTTIETVTQTMITVFTDLDASPPTATRVGDMWLPSDVVDQRHWNGSAWVSIRGADGADGAAGTNGTNGTDGADGADGVLITHQNGTDTAQEIYVQRTGASDPVSPAAGAFRIRQT